MCVILVNMRCRLTNDWLGSDTIEMLQAPHRHSVCRHCHSTVYWSNSVTTIRQKRLQDGNQTSGPLSIQNAQYLIEGNHPVDRGLEQLEWLLIISKATYSAWAASIVNMKQLMGTVYLRSFLDKTQRGFGQHQDLFLLRESIFFAVDSVRFSSAFAKAYLQL